MSVTFAKAPLIEIVAELKWNRPGALQIPQQSGQGVFFPMGSQPTDQEQFFDKFNNLVGSHGFNRTERIVPLGFPAIDFQPVYRVKRESEKELGALFHVGSGLFSANALPPYVSWHEFEPVAAIGIQSLLQARPEQEKAIPFSTLSLRYIDGFRPPLVDNIDVGSFVRNILGIKLELPDSITKHMQKDGVVKPMIQFSYPINDTTTLSMTVAEGVVGGGETMIIMDMNVTCNANIAPDHATILEKFVLARNIIHEIFVTVTTPLHSRMEPSKP